MSKRFIEPMLGRDYERHSSGSLIVGRYFPDLLAPYSSEPIPKFLSLVDHRLRLGKKQYAKQLAEQEADFKELVFKHLNKSRRSLIIVLQGRDGSGKTGARVRMSEALSHDAKIFMPVPIFKPTDEELAHPFLWRFHKYDRMPQFGQIRVFEIAAGLNVFWWSASRNWLRRMN